VKKKFHYPIKQRVKTADIGIKLSYFSAGGLVSSLSNACQYTTDKLRLYPVSLISSDL
jgi:hypothetical protein